MIDLEVVDLFDRIRAEFPFEGDQLKIRELFLGYNHSIELVKKMNKFERLLVILKAVAKDTPDTDIKVELRETLYKFENNIIY